ncbi:MAG: NAD(P)H-dependent oxidoreductase subunit E, partial [Methylobacteriaceae bacterium]|nr:NAD(P)H-dependent oxidoreductase subunit E [Methylobacteriaceae bacterium]
MAQASGEATKEPRAVHPGAGRGKALLHNKGRVLDPADVARLDALLGGRVFRRDELIEALHLVQDAEGCLPAGLLQALAERMGLPMAEIWEVASFYAHFDPLRDGQPRPAPVTLRICESLSCAMAGAEALLAALQANPPEDVRVLRAPCMGACDHAPAAALGHAQIAPASEAALRKAARDGVHSPAPTYRDLAASRAAGGYRVLAECLAGTRRREQVIAALSDAGLRGLGGAGFPTGRKWSLVAAEPAPRLMAVNADEGEPGTFKDRAILEADPHRMLEGMLIACWAVQAEAVYIYLRDEYPRAREVLTREIAALVSAGLAPHVAIHLRRGAGAYVCGEESAMIESIEGKRGLPRHRPPYVAQVGLFGRPTLVNNVETLACV